MKYSGKGHKDRKRHKKKIKKSGQVRLVCLSHEPQHLFYVKVSPRGLVNDDDGGDNKKLKMTLTPAKKMEKKVTV